MFRQLGRYGIWDLCIRPLGGGIQVRFKLNVLDTRLVRHGRRLGTSATRSDLVHRWVAKDLQISAVFMRNWDTRDETGSDVGCEWEKDWEDVKRVCQHIGIPYELISLDNIGPGYSRLLSTPGQTEGRPTGTCFVTGHYARIAYYDGRPRLMRSDDPNKDQTYYLSSVRESKLKRTLFPLSDLTKPLIRALAQEMRLPTAERGESMGLCFVVNEESLINSYATEYIPPSSGPILLYPSMKQVGEHKGLHTLTVGQNARIPGQPKKLFVAKKTAEAILVVDDVNHPALMCQSVTLANWKWISQDQDEVMELDEKASGPRGIPVFTQIRHRMVPVSGILRKVDNMYSLSFDIPIHGVAPGQVGTAWDLDWCLGAEK
ncbi:tRNA methyl transferase [Rhizoctonia solani]|uniref:tRNA methyl transferase n=1 Tax=Rhizoctonia solani TaxID=456999 RepID=A0A8H7I5R5_9AGAM|nr:tRNA methyl transferase [Rhizoctonia solani]